MWPHIIYKYIIYMCHTCIIYIYISTYIYNIYTYIHTYTTYVHEVVGTGI